MVSTVDVVCVVVFVGLILLEGQRGVVLALLDFVGVLAVVLIVRQAYVPLSGYLGSPSRAYWVLLLVGLVAVIILSAYSTKVTHVDVSGIDAAGGALLGLCTAVVLGFAFFELLGMWYGSGAAIITRSLVHSEIYELHGFRAFGELLRTLMGR